MRIWIPGEAEAGGAPDDLRGFVQHARDGGASFSTGDELLASLGLLLGSRSDLAGTTERTTKVA